MNTKIIITAACFGLVSIVLGAFGAHALKEHLDLQQLATFETGVRYQMYHALFLLFIGLSQQIPAKTRSVIFTLVSFGVVLFSGSIYLLATQTLTGMNFKPIGFVTPIGGLLLIVGWLLLLVWAVRLKSQNIDKQNISEL